MAPKKQSGSGGGDDKKKDEGKKGGYGGNKDEKKQRQDQDECDPDARGSNDPVFVPSNSKASAEDLAREFAKMSLKDQKTIAQSFETFRDELKQKMKGIPTVKQIDNKITRVSKKSEPKEKVVHQRYQKNILKLRIRTDNGKEFEIVVNASGKTGSIRREICKMLGLNISAKLVLKHETVGFINNMNKFIYSWGMADNSLIEMLGVMEEETEDDDDEEEEEEAVQSIPLGTGDVSEDETNSDDDAEDDGEGKQ